MLADGTMFEGEAIGADAAGGVERRGRVQHRALRLPGGDHRPVLRRPDHHLHLPAHRQLRRDRGRRREPAVRSAAAWSSATSPAAGATGAATATSTRSCVAHGVAGIAGVDTRRLTRHIRDAGAMPGAFGTADETDAARRPRSAEPGTDGIDLVADGHDDRALHASATGRSRVVAYDFGIKATILRHLGWLATVEVVPASTPAADVLARRPDGVFLSNGPGDPATVAVRRATPSRDLLGEVPVFGICLGHQLLARALGGRHREAAVRPPRRQPPGAPPRDRARSRSPARTTTSRSPPTRSAGRPR